MKRFNSHIMFYAAIIILFPVKAFAVCIPNSVNSSIPSPQTYSGAANAPSVGSQISPTWGQQISKSNIFNGCAPYVGNSSVLAVEPAIPGVTYSDGMTTFPVYDSGVPGIGYIIGVRDTGATTPWIPISQSEKIVYGGNAVWQIGFQVQVLLVVTSSLVTGTYTIPARTVARFYAGSSPYDHSGGTANFSLNAVTINVTARACRMISAQSITVNLPTVRLQSFTGIGSVSSESSAFSESLSCDKDIVVKATMSDVSHPENRSNYLSLSGASTASGIGINIYKNGESTPVLYGPDSAGSGTTNQWLIGNSTADNTIFNIPFLVKYTQTEARITPGNVSAVAAITFSYQ